MFQLVVLFCLQVIVTTENMCLEMFKNKYLNIDQINLAIFNNCQKIINKNSTYFKVFMLTVLMALFVLNTVKFLCS